MKKENLERGNDIQRVIKNLNENVRRLELQIEMLESPQMNRSKVTSQLFSDGFNSRGADVDKLSLLDFVNSQISKDQRKIKELEKEFDSL